MTRNVTGRSIAVIAGLLTAGTGAAHATITTGMVTGGTTPLGVFVKIAPPAAVGNDNFQSPNLFGFDEDQNITLTGPLSVDVGSGSVPSGTVVASHYVFFDPAQNRRIIGIVEFDADILGIMTSTGNLSASDFLANTGTTYLNPAARGFEPGDVATITGPRQITVDLTAGTPGDYMRVLTAYSPAAAAPEPGPLALIAAGLPPVLAGTILRRRRRN